MKTMTLCTAAFGLLLGWLSALEALSIWAIPVIFAAAVIWALLMYVEPDETEANWHAHLKPNDEA